MKKLLTIVAALATTLVFGQGLTSSSIGGRVLDDQGVPLLGTTVIVKHQPTGSVYGATSDKDGFYRLSGLRPGGPYSIEISYIGFESYTKTNMYLQLGASEQINTTLSTFASVLDEVVVSAGESSNKNGTETSISRRMIDAMPQTSRSIADFVRVSPFAQISEGSDGFSVSLAGMNNRYNAIYIDGAINNDVFGLAGSGTNGGQTGVNPFSVDAIESFQVQIAPYDVKVGGFAGGSINAVSRSGTNDFEASSYYFFRNQNLAGKTPSILAATDSDREKLPNFSAQTYGIRLGGALIENKLFYFINYERQEDETPASFNISNYSGNSSAADLANLANFIKTNYNYDVGTYDNNPTILNSDKITFKLDWNADEKNKLSLSARYVDAFNVEGASSSNRTINFYGTSEQFESKTTALSLKWDHQGSDFSNSFIVGYTAVRDDRNPYNNSKFPKVRIHDDAGNIYFGSEQYSTGNILNQDVFTITNNLELYRGKHTITVGTHNEFSKAMNVFFPSNFGYYQYFDNGNGTSGLQNFLNKLASDQYEKGYSLIGGIGDESQGSAQPELAQLGMYIQDDFQVNNRLKISAGLRFDLPIWNDGQINEHFNLQTIPLLENEGKDLQGARTGSGISSKLNISPRFGFNWDAKGDRSLIIRGGMGVFLSRIPVVWPSAAYDNNGLIKGYTFSRPGVVFNPDVNAQYVAVAPGTNGRAGDVNLFSEDFKMPSKLKTSIGIDKQYDNGWFVSFEGLYTKNLSDVYYENLNVKSPVGFLNGADNRPYYDRRDEVDNTYGRIMLGSNTNKGYAWNMAVTVSKRFKNLSFSSTYSYGEAYSIFDGTSSQNSSQWRNLETVNGKNSTLTLARSDFNQGHRVIANASYEKEWNNNLKTQIGIFYEGSQGSPFSYVYNNGDDLLVDDSRGNALIYVPANAREITLQDPSQYAALEAYINGNDYLRSRKGQYAERNGEMGPWSDIIDLRIVQDIAINVGSTNNTLQLTADIFNLGNLLNKKWGRKFFASNTSILGVDGATQLPDPVFQVRDSEFDYVQVSDRGLKSSRWQAQIGVRYTFK
jgi:hypothetical protein